MGITIIAACGSLIASLGTLVFVWYVSRAVTAVHVSINSRMNQLLAATAISSRAEGMQAQRDDVARGGCGTGK